MIYFDIADINDIPKELLAFELENLSAHDREKISTSKHSLAVRCLLRSSIKKYFGVKEYSLYYSEKGKPMLEFCCLSFSHSGRYAACAVSDKPVGIDIEQKRDIKRRKKYHCFTDNEVSFVNSSDNGVADKFLKVWTRKEAYLKCTDCNTAELSHISVLSDNNGFEFITENHNDYVYSICVKKL